MLHACTGSFFPRLNELQTMAVVNIPENPSQLQSTEEHQTSPFFEDFSFVKLLGKGAFGCVCMALKKKEKKHFAVKCIELEEENVQLGNREVKVRKSW